MMIQASNRVPDVEVKKVLCHYHNDTRHIQVVRIENIPYEHFERVIFPGNHLVFKTFHYAWLEIYTAVSRLRLCRHIQLK